MAKKVEDSKVNGQAAHVFAAIVENYLARGRGQYYELDRADLDTTELEDRMRRTMR